MLGVVFSFITLALIWFLGGQLVNTGYVVLVSNVSLPEWESHYHSVAIFNYIFIIISIGIFLILVNFLKAKYKISLFISFVILIVLLIILTSMIKFTYIEEGYFLLITLIWVLSCLAFYFLVIISSIFLKIRYVIELPFSKILGFPWI